MKVTHSKLEGFLIGAGITMLIPIVGFPLVPAVPAETAALLMFCLAMLVLVLEGEQGQKLSGALGAGVSALAFLVLPATLLSHGVYVAVAFISSQYFRNKAETSHVQVTATD